MQICDVSRSERCDIEFARCGATYTGVEWHDTLLVDARYSYVSSDSASLFSFVVETENRYDCIGPNLFRPILAIKFDPNPKDPGRTVAIVDHTAALLGVPFPSSNSIPTSLTTVSSETSTQVAQAFAFHIAILSFISTLSMKHADAMTLAVNSSALIPELLTKIASDVRIVWSSEGKEIGAIEKGVLKLYVLFLSCFIAASPFDI